MTMKTNLGFRVGTSSRRVSRYSLPSKPGAGPRYVLLKATDRCLVLEDLLPRQLRFRAWCGSSAKIVNTAPKAIQELQQQHFDVVFLDRDLGLNAGFGEEVAKFLAGMQPPFNGRVYIHSVNHTAAEYMAKILADAAINVELAPFDLLGVLRERCSAHLLETKAR